MQNPYIPYPVIVDKIITEVDTKDIKTFRFKFVNPEDEQKYAYIPGQFGEKCGALISLRKNRRGFSVIIAFIVC